MQSVRGYDYIDSIGLALRSCKTTHDMLGGLLLACSWTHFTIIYTYPNVNVRISAPLLTVVTMNLVRASSVRPHK